MSTDSADGNVKNGGGGQADPAPDKEHLDELVELLVPILTILNNGNKEIRQGACSAVLRLLAIKTKLSRSDILSVHRNALPKTAPAEKAKADAKPSKAKQEKLVKVTLKADQVQSDYATYPELNRGRGSTYQDAIREARQIDKAATQKLRANAQNKKRRFDASSSEESKVDSEKPAVPKFGDSKPNPIGAGPPAPVSN